MPRRLAIIALACAATLNACITRHRVALTPEGDRLKREVTTTVHMIGREDFTAVVARDPAAFGDDPPAMPEVTEVQTEEDRPVPTVAGRFVTSTEGDIGSAGAYRQVKTRMGTLRVYFERMRGSHDLAEGLQQDLDAVDVLVRFLDGWFTWQLADDPDAAGLTAFIRGEFRQDARNVLTYLFMAQNDVSGERMTARIAAYLHERRYFELDDVPRVLRALVELEQETAETEPLLALVQRVLATRMSVPPDEPIPASLGFLSGAQKVSESLEAYYQHQIARGVHQPDPAAPADPPRLPADVDAAVQRFGNALFSLVLWDDRLNATMASPTEPLWTNGTWDAEAGRILWLNTALPQEQALPHFCAAVWAEPDTAFQERHFGQVVVQNEALATYVLWRRGLTAAEAEQWDRFLDALRPGPDLPTQMIAFRFTSDPPLPPADSDDPPSPSHATLVINWILQSSAPEEW